VLSPAMLDAMFALGGASDSAADAAVSAEDDERAARPRLLGRTVPDCLGVPNKSSRLALGCRS